MVDNDYVGTAAAAVNLDLVLAMVRAHIDTKQVVVVEETLMVADTMSGVGIEVEAEGQEVVGTIVAAEVAVAVVYMNFVVEVAVAYSVEQLTAR